MEAVEENLTWLGETMIGWRKVSLSSVGDLLPRFDRKPFGANERMDVITRRPFTHEIARDEASENPVR